MSNRILVATLGSAIVGTGFIGPIHVEALRRLGRPIAGILGSAPEKGRAAAAALEIPRHFDRFEVSFKPCAIKAGLLQILCGADECARLSTNGIAQSRKCATGFGSEEDQSFFSLRRNGDENSFVTDGLVPGFGASEPVFGRGIGGSTQERDHH